MDRIPFKGNTQGTAVFDQGCQGAEKGGQAIWERK